VAWTVPRHVTEPRPSIFRVLVWGCAACGALLAAGHQFVERAELAACGLRFCDLLHPDARTNEIVVGVYDGLH